MLLLIAWRNIWRNRIRSLVVICSIAVGLWAGIFVMAFSWGMYQGHIHEVIRYQLSHLQVHHPLFSTEKDVRDSIAGSETIVNSLRNNKDVKEAVLRSRGFGMIMAPSNSYGVVLSGVDPGPENRITDLKSLVIEGNYLSDVEHKRILIGKKLADKLKAEVKSKLVIMIQDVDGEIVSGAFRVEGIFKSRNSTFDESNIFISRTDFNKMINAGNTSHEIAVLLHDENSLVGVQKDFKTKYPNLEIKSWRELSPELDMVISSFNQYMYIFMGIILLALMFGIVNTMLMAVLERQHELGMLMAIGMNRIRIFFMIMIETILLAITGGPLGILFSHLTIIWLGNSGIDLSMFSQGLSVFGFSTVIYPDINPDRYIPIMFMTMGVSVIAAIYPAYKALRLKPATAIRKI